MEAQNAFSVGSTRHPRTWENVISPLMRRALEPSGPPFLKASCRKPLEDTQKQEHHECSDDFITAAHADGHYDIRGHPIQGITQGVLPWNGEMQSSSWDLCLEGTIQLGIQDHKLNDKHTHRGSGLWGTTQQRRSTWRYFQHCHLRDKIKAGMWLLLSSAHLHMALLY